MAESAKPWAQDPLYTEGLQALQVGDWEEAEDAFSQLLRRYTSSTEAVTELRPLLEEARLRLSLDESYGKKVARARKPLPTKRILVWTAIVLCVAVIGYVVVAANDSPVEAAFATPDVEATVAAQRVNLLQEARAALAAGDYPKALAILQDILSRFPWDEEAKELLRWANERWQLYVLYHRAGTLMEQEDWAGAVAALEEIQQRDPVYRDSAALLEEARARLGLASVWDQAEAAFADGRWAEAVERFEEIHQSYPDYRRDEVNERLYASYFNWGLATLERAPEDGELVRKAIEYYSKALTYKPGDVRATNERKLAQTYLPAYRAYHEGRLDDAIRLLEPIYNVRFTYMANTGTVAQMLYDSYFARAQQYEAEGEIEKAIQDYAAAERLTGPDTSEASQKRLALTLALTPTPTPVPPPTPTPFKWSPALIPTPTPPPPLSSYKGQIAFWTDREGVTQIFLMNPDGSNQRPAGLARWGRTEFEDLRRQETISPDGRWQIYVAAGNNRIAQIWIMELENGRPTPRNKQLTSLDDVCYDPVWSPDGYHIAFVSEHTGSDDIWVIGADGTGVRQLTKNDWEWEKHPSWSPDGSKIVYWSNLGTGRQQIWIMNADGSNQMNLSNNEYNDWDPIWIK